MRQHTFAFACLCSLAAITFVSAVPLPADDRELDVLQIPLENGKEIDVLTLGAKDQEQMIADRNKRTVGLLRELFPDLTKEIDSIVNRIIAQVIRVVGPSLLPTLLGNRSPTPRSNTFDADFDDDDEDSDSSDSDSNGNGGDDDKTDLGTNSIPKGFATRTNVQIDLPTFQQEGEEVSTTPASNAAITNKVSASDSMRAPTTTSEPIQPISYYIDPRIDFGIERTTPKMNLINATQNFPTPMNPTANPLITTKAITAETTTSPDETTTLANSIDLIQTPSSAVDVDESQIVAIIDNLNSLLNSTNYFITTRDKLNTTTKRTATTTTVITATQTATTPASAPSTVIKNTSQITKLLPNGATDTQIDLSAINKQLEETIRVARQVKEAEAAAQAVASSQQQPQQLPIPASNEPIQLSFNNEVTPSLNALSDNSKSVNNDLQSSESKSPAIDELTLDSNEDTADLDDRNKRFLSFGGAGLAGGSSGGSNAGAGGAGAAPGGSGNFLFDIVRLFSGSVQTQAGDESANSANSVSGSGDGSGDDADTTRAADGYTEGIPGPVTRLVVLANRGLANLVQDLILRVAATSEKFVNFKAKLITALI